MLAADILLRAMFLIIFIVFGANLWIPFIPAYCIPTIVSMNILYTFRGINTNIPLSSTACKANTINVPIPCLLCQYSRYYCITIATQLSPLLCFTRSYNAKPQILPH